MPPFCSCPAQEIVSRDVDFNERGLVGSSLQPYFTGDQQYLTSYSYDPRNRLLQTELPDLATIDTVYGLTETTTYDPEGHPTMTARDATGFTRYFVEYLGANDIVTTTVTDIEARTETTYDDDANVTTTLYDSLGRPITVVDPDSGTDTLEHNDASELVAVTNSLGERTELTYDLLGRMLTKTTLAGTPNAETTTFVYDEPRVGYFNVGFQTSMRDAAGHRYDDFDALGRPARSLRRIDTSDYTFEFDYNAAGLPTSTLYPDTQTIQWSYDAAGNLQTETGTINSSTYDAAGRLTSRSFAGSVTASTSYSPERGWIEAIGTAGATQNQGLTYTHYDDGMIETVTSVNAMESWSYVYDDLNRLLAATNVDTPSLTQSFTYDDIGNITDNSDIGTYSYPVPGTARPHAVTAAGSRTYQYDAAGRMTSRNGTVIQWNGDGKPSTIGNVAFVYDGVGERLKKISGGQTTTYLGGDYEIAHDGTVTKYLIGGKEVGTEFFALHRDHLGSIQAVTDDTADTVRQQSHKPFGDQHNVSGTHLESKGWIGEREEETELVYLNARYYDPEIGRFISPDPIVRPGQRLDRYAYAANNPIGFLDPEGLNCARSEGIWFGDKRIRGPVVFSTCDGGGGGGPSPSEKHGNQQDKLSRREERRQDREDRRARGELGARLRGSDGDITEESYVDDVDPDNPDNPDDDDDGEGSSNDNNDASGTRPPGATLAWRLGAFWDGVIPGESWDPFTDLYENNCEECWLSEDIGVGTFWVETTILFGNNNPILRFGRGWKKFPDGSAVRIWRFASGGRFFKGGRKLPWHWHWP